MRTYRDKLMDAPVEYLLEEMNKRRSDILVAKRDLEIIRGVLQEKGVVPMGSSPDRYVICALNACQFDRMFWSDKLEWTSLDKATLFNQEFKDRCVKPQMGDWVKLPPVEEL